MADAAELELDIIQFLRDLGFADVNGGAKFIIGGRQVDACAGHEETLLIFECTTARSAVLNTKIDQFRGILPDLIKGFRKHSEYKKYKKYVFVLAVNSQVITEAVIRRAQSTRKYQISIWNKKYRTYFKIVQGILGQYAKYDLLADLEISPSVRKTIRMKASRLALTKSGYLFQFIAPSDWLLESAYVARRSTGNPTYYQRMLSKARVAEIAKNYLDSGKTFPNNIVISLEKGSWTFKQHSTHQGTKVHHGELEIKNGYRNCWVIDGQHRLYSYSKSRRKGYLLVSAFAGIDEARQAEYFVEINQEAQGVDKDLIWDLVGSMEPKTEDGIISNSAKILRERRDSLFYQNIKIPSQGEGAFKLNGLCVAIKKNELGELWISGKSGKKIRNPIGSKSSKAFSQKIATALGDFFEEINSGLDKETRPKVFTNGFVSIMVFFFKLFLIERDRLPTKVEYKKYLSSFFEFVNALDTNGLSNLRASLSSEGGKLRFRNQMILKLQEQLGKGFASGLVEEEKTLVQKIKELEFRINRFANVVLAKELSSDWANDPEINLNQVERDKSFKLARKHGKPQWEFLNVSSTVSNIIISKKFWDPYFKTYFEVVGLDKNELSQYIAKLWDYRSRVEGHYHDEPVVFHPNRIELLEKMYKNISAALAEAED